MAFSFPTINFSAPPLPTWETHTTGITPAPVQQPAGTTSENLAAGNNIGQLTQLINALNVGGQQRANFARVPNDPALETQSSGNIADALQGKVPADVLRLLGQQGAERGVSTGSPGSPNANAAYLQALGLTSLGMESTGQSWLTAADARNPVAPLFDPTGQVFSAAQGGQLGLEGQRVGIEAANALNRGGVGGGGGVSFPHTSGTGTTGTGGGSDMSWLNNLFGNTGTGSTGGAGDPYLNWLASIGAGGQPVSPAGPSDPGGELALTNNLYSEPPAGTISTATQSSYDPFAQYAGAGSVNPYAFSLPMATGGDGG